MVRMCIFTILAFRLGDVYYDLRTHSLDGDAEEVCCSRRSNLFVGSFPTVAGMFLTIGLSGILLGSIRFDGANMHCCFSSLASWPGLL